MSRSHSHDGTAANQTDLSSPQVITPMIDHADQQNDPSCLRDIVPDLGWRDVFGEPDDGNDFDQQFRSCLASLAQVDITCDARVMARRKTDTGLRSVAIRDLLDGGLYHYALVRFDGGHTRGDRWTHLFFPASRTHRFVPET
ncbi:hypothetical protein ACMAUO_14680 [Gluconacetobacter sp. Hr-1-5]|uniref:hypothetical protein n=1 Tax=Gluconacetobacter sp. Hr-1-5 TaxID=3395370 RepID=UPI003B52F15F